MSFITLAEFIPSLTPRFASPLHLAPLLDVYQRVAIGEEVRVVVSLPPRHGKTETLLHGIAWLLAQRPELQIIYASYAARIAEKKSRRARELAKKAGVPLASDSKSRQDWRTGVDDGGVWATSIDGSVTGEGAHLLVCDDLIKGRAEAESAATRERAHGWLLSDALTRLEPGASVIVNMTRWHPEDPAGHAIALGWEHVNLTAITPEGASLWPERWPLERMLKIRETLGGEDGYEWQSLYQGNPRGRGSRVFGDVQFFDSLPVGARMRVSIGLDFAYSTRTSADYSVAVVMAHIGELHYVLDVIRVQEEPRDFRERVRNAVKVHPGASAAAYAAATEMGGVEFIRDGGIHVKGHVAKLDKFSRAIPVAAAWNMGKILLPRRAPWLNAFVSEVCGFTGVKDRHDDQVDALAAAFDDGGGYVVIEDDMISAGDTSVSTFGTMDARAFAFGDEPGRGF
ncbi:MAG TPA: phage terminase large subunit [Polyangiaceae bacterium]|nr:phage terminase large subunit [Polyangiaceae bacterium]HMR74434.1 phage terminase large subunit [Polyangiaceae bacterium]